MRRFGAIPDEQGMPVLNPSPGHSHTQVLKTVFIARKGVTDSSHPLVNRFTVRNWSEHESFGAG